MEKPFTFEVSPDFDHVIEEHGNTYVAFRKIRWGDSETFKPDLRKYYATEEGERMSKGCTFSEGGACELTKALIEEGYGNDNDLFVAIKDLRPTLYSRFIDDIINKSDPEALMAHLEEYPTPNDVVDVEFYDLGDVIGKGA